MLEKDYYEILGIRPSASQDEIDLAYRGRRSQYHPDRYANADEETLAWATSKMKEVNEAHAALKDPDERARFDRMRKGGGAESSASSRPETTADQAPSLLEILQAYEPDNEFYQKIHVAPNIPRKKLNGAIDNYGNGLSPKDVVALIDDTVFGGAKEGVLITEREIRFKAILESPSIIALEKIERIACARNRVSINGREVAKLNVPDEDETIGFFDLLNDYCKRRASSPHEDGRKSRGEQGRSNGAESILSRFEKGFYRKYESSIGQQILASRGSERMTLEFIKQLLPISRTLESWTTTGKDHLTNTQRSYLSSDAVRFEVLIYCLAVAEKLLHEFCIDHERAHAIVSSISVMMLFTFVMDMSNIRENEGINSREDFQREMKRNPLYRELVKRWEQYQFFLKKEHGGGIFLQFESAIRYPALLSIYSEPDAENLRKLSEKTIDETMTSDDIIGFINKSFNDVGNSLSRLLG